VATIAVSTTTRGLRLREAIRRLSRGHQRAQPSLLAAILHSARSNDLEQQWQGYAKSAERAVLIVETASLSASS
jgi:CRISPR/Cas system-associated endoribonuclease Cas2